MKKLLAITIVLLMTASVALAQSNADGVWESNGYGYVFVVKGASVEALYEVSSVHCVTATIPIPLSDLNASIEGDQLIVRDTHTVYITAHPLAKLPVSCEKATASDDPELNFEAFWNTFNEQYVSFNNYGVDWKAQYDLYRPQITAKTTPDQLWDVLCKMIQPLKDGHLSLEGMGKACEIDGILPKWAASGQQAFMDIIQGFQVIAKTYLGGDVQLDFQTGRLSGDKALIAGDLMFYGHISDQVGYVNILSMEPYAETGDAGVYAAIDRVLADLADVKTIIVDVRYNGGGSDAISLGIASRFADQEREAFSKQTRMGDSFTPLRTYTIAPQGKTQFKGQVILLTSGMTVSAAETFTLAMESLPNVTQIGETTLGAYSDILFRTLPNGWHYGLSNEQYFDSKGVNYEGAGDPPATEVIPDLSAYKKGRDNVLDTVIASIK